MSPRVLTLSVLCFAVLACQPQRPRVRAMGGVVIECTTPTAQIFVDDRYMGTVKGLSAKPLELRAGAHRLELRADGYFDSYHDIRVVAGVRQKLQVELRREPF